MGLFTLININIYHVHKEIVFSLVCPIVNSPGRFWVAVGMRSF